MSTRLFAVRMPSPEDNFRCDHMKEISSRPDLMGAFLDCVVQKSVELYENFRPRGEEYIDGLEVMVKKIYDTPIYIKGDVAYMLRLGSSMIDPSIQYNQQELRQQMECVAFGLGKVQSTCEDPEKQWFRIRVYLVRGSSESGDLAYLEGFVSQKVTKK